MSDEKEEFQQRWGFRRNDSDVDSSSNDQSRRSSESEPKRKKHKSATRLFPDKDDQKTVHSPQSHMKGEDHSSDEEPNTEPKTTGKKQGRKARTRKVDRKASDDKPAGGASIDLSGHMESLVEDVKVAREGLLKWMSDELEHSCKDDKTSQPPTVAKKIQRRGSKEAQTAVIRRTKTPRSNNQNRARRKSRASTQNPEDGSSDKLAKDRKTSHETSEVVVPANEPTEKVSEGPTTPVEKNQRQKGKRVGSSSKKQKVAAPASDQQTDKAPEPAPATAASASASNYLTLPTVLPRQEAENNEKTNSEGENAERAMRSRNALMNQAINLSSQLNFTPRSQPKDGMFSQNGLRNVSEYEQTAAQTSGNNIWGAGNGNGNTSMFPFGLHSQGGLNGGIGMPNFPSQFGLQYLSQESILSGLRMNGGHPVSLPTGNHNFNDSYGAYNQQLRFKAQGGLMPLHSPDNIRAAANLQPR
ncbi:hypothetical protein vseg_006291 [Gypsophila vaccaria]